MMRTAQMTYPILVNIVNTANPVGPGKGRVVQSTDAQMMQHLYKEQYE